MSTEHQQYSLDNQSTAIQGMPIRKDLKLSAHIRMQLGVACSKTPDRSSQLLQDVVSGAPGYRSSSSTMSAVGDDFKTPTSPQL